MDGIGELLQLEGTVTNLIYTNPENGYTVLRLKTGSEESVTAVGCIPDAAVGEMLILSGNWTTHASYGQQFKAEMVQRFLPSDRRAIFDYLSSGAVKGIGPALAVSIVREFGDSALEVIENEPERLAEIKGISPKKAAAISRAFKQQSGIRKLMEFFAPYGLRPQLAVSLYKCYGDAAADAVRDNPYILTREYFGADFFEADNLAISLGFEEDCAQRLEAALLFELRHNLENGHTFLPAGKLVAATEQLIGVSAQLLEEALTALEDAGLVIREPVAGQDACYLDTVYEAERYVAETISAMAAAPAEKRDFSRLIGKIEKQNQITYAGAQREAVAAAGKNRIMALTGGPGTGKTTTVRGILSLFDELELETALAAPTGRAAKRMSELTDREAATIHRLLGAGLSADGDGTVFERGENDPLHCDALILDEASMIDIKLMAALLRALKPGCRLVIVGDADQLPSVGPGNVFSDILRSEIVPTIRLTEIFRQAGRSAIVKNAHKINEGVIPDLGENKGDFFFLQRMGAEKTADTIVELCTVRLPKNMGIEPGQIQVLSPSRRGPAGTGNLNRLLQAAVNPPEEGKNERQYGDYIFREGDRVMQIRNNYDIMWTIGGEIGSGVYNGDVGRIFSINPLKEQVIVDFDGRLCSYPFDLLYELEPAYAMTVHKSQGSEYRAVIIAADSSCPAMLRTRGVLYTGVTRARELLILVGSGETVKTMILDDRRQRRYSGLKFRLSNGRF